MPYCVRENLYIGNIGDAAHILQNSSDADKHDGGGDSGGVTHILSLLSETSISFFKEWRGDITIPVTHQIKRVFLDDDNDDDDDDDKSSSSSKSCLYSLEKAGKVVRMAVPLKDMESQNLVDYLEPCLDFIHLHRTPPSSVLVHCFAGVSRSAAVVTAYLMRTEKLSLQDALASLKQACDFVCPNDGFLDQLKMFGEMGFKVDHTNPLYKRFRLKVLGDSYNRGEKIDSSKFGTDPGIYKVLPSKSEGCPDGGNKCTAYRCKKCRRVVALQENVVDHVPDDGDASFAWHKRKSGNLFNKSDMSECSSLFVEPLKWMTAVEGGAMEGKLSCVHCEARLGYFNWCGIQCSCGSWISPAFQIHKSRVDISAL